MNVSWWVSSENIRFFPDIFRTQLAKMKSVHIKPLEPCKSASLDCLYRPCCFSLVSFRRTPGNYYYYYYYYYLQNWKYRSHSTVTSKIYCKSQIISTKKLHLFFFVVVVSPVKIIDKDHWVCNSSWSAGQGVWLDSQTQKTRCCETNSYVVGPRQSYVLKHFI